MGRPTSAELHAVAALSIVLALVGATPAASSATLPPSFVPGQWTWVSGSNTVAEQVQYGVFGTKGISDPSNVPGMREGSVAWSDANGTFWLFGGIGYAASAFGLLNDLWKWDSSSGEWTWVSGSRAPDEPGAYGTKGVAASGNVPAARDGAVSWTDRSGNLWLFGGSGLNDLWKWTISTGQWTWVSGSSEGNVAGSYGTRGVPSPTNNPGGRLGSVSWTDAQGDLWLFGGDGYSASGWGHLNDLWKWSISVGQWTWVSGSNAPNQPGSYGTTGTPAPGNVPGGRYGAVSWADANGNLWLFGGLGYGLMNDLWRFSIAGEEWTWVSGYKEAGVGGIYGEGGIPGARKGSVSWIDAKGNLWLFGGEGLGPQGCEACPGGAGPMNDFWKWNISDGQWTWVGGAVVSGQPPRYGARGVMAPGNDPGARDGAVSWIDGGGDLWLFGGPGNDLWKWSLSSGEWTWVSGSNALIRYGVYGTQGVPAPENVPGARIGAVSWTDPAGKLWLFGGSGYAGSVSRNPWASLNDLWRWNATTAEWTWMSGSSGADQPGVYGTQGIPAPGNVPGARDGAVSWTDRGGNLWLFGGSGFGANAAPSRIAGPLNDLWKWDVTSWEWAWMSGSSETYRAGGVYGTRGMPALANVPGQRDHAASWTDASGKLWLFGGNGQAGGGVGALNDLWTWDVSTGMWTWVSGSSEVNQAGVYGAQGMAEPGNGPGARFGAVSWADTSGSLWLFGGVGYAATVPSSRMLGCLNDLWKWNATSGEWAWISGSNEADQACGMGTQGMTAPGKGPGARSGAVSWADASGNLWLLGGQTATALPGDIWRADYLSDLWRWSISAGEWTWVSGPTEGSQVGTYGVQRIADPGNAPGARSSALSWADAAGRLWLFGGRGHASTPTLGTLNDLWAYTYCAIPSAPAGLGRTRLGLGTVVLSATGAATGQDYRWYAAQSGGFPLQTSGATFTTPRILLTTTYYVAIYDTATGCESARTPVTATVGSLLGPVDVPVRRVRG